MMGFILANASRWLRHKFLLAEITSHENQLLLLAQIGEGKSARADEIRGLLALAYARLSSDEFNPATAG